MGIRFTTNTWRAPLQLIDCWLPTQPPAATRASSPGHRLLQRFVKAGWLRRHSATDIASGLNRPLAQKLAQPTTSIRPFNDPRPGNASHRYPTAHRKDGRLALSGRIDQVCAELERLAALEQRMVQ